MREQPAARLPLLLAAWLALAAGPARAAAIRGPSSSATPYVVPLAAGVDTTALLTAGDAIGAYPMRGLPDGLGVFDNGDGTLTLLVNHELGRGQGTLVPDHGALGAFVSKWTLDAASLAVVAGDDLVQTLNLSDVQGADGGVPSQLSRFCSADLPAESAFYDAATGLGTRARIFMNGEESGPEGRAFAHVATGASAGQSYQLPRLGRFAHENSVAAPGSGAKTLVIGLDDATPGQLYAYVGDKTGSGSEIERAGLENGTLYGIRIPGVALESRSAGLGAGKGVPVAFGLAALGDRTATTGAQLQAASTAAGVTELLRPEDGAFDPRHPNDFYFVTTDRFDLSPASPGRSRLWRLRFDDVANPTAGGTVAMLLDGTEGQQMLDNLTVDRFGNILIQEDPGGTSHLAKLWAYHIDTGALLPIAQHDPSRFLAGGSQFLTLDEESSGIVDATALLDPNGTTGRGYAFFDVMAHYPNGATLVEGGQLLLLSYDPALIPEPATAALLAGGLAGIALVRRRARRAA